MKRLLWLIPKGVDDLTRRGERNRYCASAAGMGMATHCTPVPGRSPISRLHIGLRLGLVLMPVCLGMVCGASWWAQRFGRFLFALFFVRLMLARPFVGNSSATDDTPWRRWRARSAEHMYTQTGRAVSLCLLRSLRRRAASEYWRELFFARSAPHCLCQCRHPYASDGMDTSQHRMTLATSESMKKIQV